MSVLIPQLDRESARELISEARATTLQEAGALMPRDDVSTSLNPVGGNRISRDALIGLREAIIAVAEEHGFPEEAQRSTEFDARAALELRRALQITPYEASSEEAWSYLTCCVLLDVAIWRFPGDADERRFIGNVNRNTFRRLWWRAEILDDRGGRDGSETFRGLGEDELVNIMERPTIASNTALARTIMHSFADRMTTDPRLESDRMHLMRELSKRLLRLTPFVFLDGLRRDDLRRLVESQLDEAVAQLPGSSVSAVEGATDVSVPAASAAVEVLPGSITDAMSRKAVSEDHLEQAAMEIATRVGRVTNGVLREAHPVSADEARAALSRLVDQGLLERRGVRRGTHYIPVAGAPLTTSLKRRSGDALKRLVDGTR